MKGEREGRHDAFYVKAQLGQVSVQQKDTRQSKELDAYGPDTVQEHNTQGQHINA